MRTVALVSGGKDSAWAAQLVAARGRHRIVAAALLHPRDAAPDELDSMAFQTVGHNAVRAHYAACLGVPLFTRALAGSAVRSSMDYDRVVPGDEVEDLHALLATIQAALPDVQAVCVGAILSDYQRIRVEHVCQRLGLVVLAPLWRQPQPVLLRDMAACGIHAILIKVAAMGLDTRHLGQDLVRMQPHLLAMNDAYGLHPCGEGGEFETLTLDAPFFRQRLVIDQSDVVMHSDDAFAPVAYLHITHSHLEPKPSPVDPDAFPMPTWTLPAWPDLPEGLHQACRDLAPLPPLAWPTATTTPWRTTTRHHPHFLALSSIVAPSATASVQEETRLCLSQLQDRLEAAKVSRHDLVAVHVCAASLDDFARINAAYGACFAARPPVRVFIQTPCLPPGRRVMLDAIASTAGPRRVMHVQSLSHWAPANIGPYSQSVHAGGLLWIAGQIGMVPFTLELPDLPPHATLAQRAWAQACLALQHVQAIYEAATARACDARVFCQRVCYVTHPALAPVVEAAWRTWAAPHATEAAVSVVAVAGLPKHALVEWHVVAQHAAPAHEDHVAVVTATAAADTWAAGLDQLQTQLRQQDAPWSAVAVLRCFVASAALLAQAQHACQSWCAQHGVALPALALVPASWVSGGRGVSLHALGVQAHDTAATATTKESTTFA